MLFVASASDTANDPIYGRSAMASNSYQSSDYKSKPERQARGKLRATSFVTNTSSEPVSTSNSKSKSSCPLCQHPHDLDNCKTFLRKTIDERRIFLKENHLCFGCYGKNHISKGCVQKHVCEKCNKRHPTALHIDGFKPKQLSLDTEREIARKEIDSNDSCQNTVKMCNKSTCTATDVSESVVLHGILPVKITQQGSSNVVTTYCFYDNGSSGCFLTDDLFDKLNASGVRTHLQLKTMHGTSYSDSSVVSDLIVTDLHGNNAIRLPKVYTRDVIPVNVSQMVKQWQHLRHVATELPPYLPDIDIGILIGNNCPEALEPLKVVPTVEGGPFATLLRHGWAVFGPLQNYKIESHDVTCNRIIIHEKCKEMLTPVEAISKLERDFDDHYVASHPDELGKSQEDIRFLKLLEDGIIYEDGHYTVPLPFRNNDVILPNNKAQAMKRVLWQKRKMMKDDNYYNDYVTFMTKILDRGYGERVKPDHEDSPGKDWYLPHHGVYNPNKPNKIRVVFDCSALYHGTCLNHHLQGPDLANNLVGVLSRFRLNRIVFIADIEAMFFQVRFPERHRCFLRFLWWPDGDLSKELEEYQMTVHLFGANSSPSVANYVLKMIGTKAADPLVTQTIHRNFYVDDCLKATESEEMAKYLAKELIKVCKEGGFRLTKFLSNSNEVIRSIPEEEHAKEMLVKDLSHGDVPMTKTLGVQWYINTDQFGFNIQLKDKLPTRRGILSTISTIYDPLGFLAPAVLPAKKILQDLCREKHIGWDDDIPHDMLIRWQQWLSSISLLESVKIDRCLKPSRLHQENSTGLHVFSDASSSGYGSAAYLRTLDSSGKFHVGFVAGKARLAPLKPTSIPRLELTAAVTSVRLAKLIQKEIDEPLTITYYTDSMTVLRYIGNDRRRFPVFVANRVQLIREFSVPDQWKYVPSDFNPADEASRGISSENLITTAKWLEGPDFLYSEESVWPTTQISLIDEEESSQAPTNIPCIKRV